MTYGKIHRYCIKISRSCWIRVFHQRCHMPAKRAWTLKGEDRRRLDVYEVECYSRRMLRIRWTQKRTDDCIRVQINRQQTVTTRVLERIISLGIFAGCSMAD
jgi:hypothetical protein